MLFKPRSQHRRLQLGIADRRFLIRSGDILATLIATFIALLIWAWVDQNDPTPLFIIQRSYWFIILPGLWLFLASVNGLYDLPLINSREATAVRLLFITTQLLVIYLLLFFLAPRDILPRLFVLYYGAAAYISVALWRLVLRPLFMSWASERRHILIVGSSWESEMIIQIIREYATAQYNIVGVIDSQQQDTRQISGIPILKQEDQLYSLVLQRNVVELVVAHPYELSETLFQGVMDCHQQGISIVPMTILHEQLTGRVPVKYVGRDWANILPLEQTSMFDPYLMIHRLMDIILAIIGLLVFALLLPVIALAIYLDSPGPIFFRQTRVGKAGKSFGILKLRSMIPNAEAKTGAQFATQNDPRITKVGRFLRKSRLDEVPQLWNVLRGEMSIIGPRPERPEFIEALTEEIPFYRSRLAIKPGLTGWAQVHYDYAENFEGHLIKLQYDLYYIRHQSILLDVQIVLRTIVKVLSMAGQ